MAFLKIKKTFVLGILLFFLLNYLSFSKLKISPIKRVEASGNSNFRIQIIPGPQCYDGLDNDGDSKTDWPADPGCNSASDNNETDSVPTTTSGGGSSAATEIPIVTSISFSGRAYPLSKVSILKDGQLAISTVAGPDANFNVNLSGLSSGNYVFSIYGEDEKGNRSSLFNFPIFITKGAATNVSGIFISPTIAIDKNIVKKGDNIAIFGQSAPESEITISVNSAEEHFNKIRSDKKGVYLYNFDTSVLELGQHSTRSKSALGGDVSYFSESVKFSVGSGASIEDKKKLIGDLNSDNRVNLVDFSIAAFWYKRESVPGEMDLNGDGKLNLIDFSIMAYYWTG